MFVFPAFRSDAWVRRLVDEHVCPSPVLDGVDLTPAYMAANPSAALYTNKARETREQIRRALFRHSLFKIQNVEVTSECRSDRVLTSIVHNKQTSFTRDILDSIVNEKSTKFVREEIWELNRCGTTRKYAVRYYREGDDGFSSKVFPLAIADKVAMLKYYFT